MKFKERVQIDEIMNGDGYYVDDDGRTRPCEPFVKNYSYYKKSEGIPLDDIVEMVERAFHESKSEATRAGDSKRDSEFSRFERGLLLARQEWRDIRSSKENLQKKH